MDVSEEITDDVNATEEVLEVEVGEVAETAKEKVTETIVEPQQVERKIRVIEKHAQVDLKEFNTVQSRKVLELKEDDEIIEFEPSSLNEKVGVVATQVITPITSSDTNKISDEIVKNQQLTIDSMQQEVAKIDTIADASVVNPVEVNVTQSEITAKVADIPAVVVPPVEVKFDDNVKKQQDEFAKDSEDVVEEITEEVEVSIEKTLDEIVAPEIATVVNKPKKEKKSWFGWFKRDKKTQDSVVEQVAENIVVNNQEQVEEVKEDLKQDVKEDIAGIKELVESVEKEVVEISEKQDVDVLNNENIPLIRTTKAEVEELEKEEQVVEEKKKFTWWWKKEKSEVSESQSLPEKRVKEKKINWKKVFTPKQKSVVKEIEALNDNVNEQNNRDE